MKNTNLLKFILIIHFVMEFFIAAAQVSDDELIRQQRQRSNEAIAKHDTASISSFWLENIHVVTSRSTSQSGRQANQLAFQQEFQNKEQVQYVRTPGTIETFLKWNMAAEYGQWTGSWLTGKSPVRIGGSYYAKWHKVNGAWKIRSEIYTPSWCEGSAYCDGIVVENNMPAIVVQNLYYPKPGKEKEVLEWRQRASQVRQQLGLPAGRILERYSEGDGQPFVIWECEYNSLKAREDDVAKLDQSAEFKAVQDHMGTLLEKFDRLVLRIRN